MRRCVKKSNGEGQWQLILVRYAGTTLKQESEQMFKNVVFRSRIGSFARFKYVV
jgi:hypothetical protein